MRAAGDTVKTLAAAALAALVLVLFAPWRDARASDDTDSVHARGRALTHWFSTGQFDRVLGAMSPQLRATVGGHEGLARLVQARNAQAGEETALVDEAAYHERGLVDYYRVARHAALPASQTVTTQWLWQPGGAVVGLRISPTPQAAPKERLEYRTKTSLALPFEGRWYVAWGGRAAHQNHHLPSQDQRFAYDLLVLQGGRSHTGAGHSNVDYFCFGRPVFAPAAGRVTSVVDGVLDNTPGTMREDKPAGNHVVIDHGNGEHSLLAHLRRGSVAVKRGATVERGERLGECGNSGRSSEPHLHYHLQTAPVFGEGEGLPAAFVDYFSGGEHRARGKPVRGEVIHRLPSTDSRAKR